MDAVVLTPICSAHADQPARSCIPGRRAHRGHPARRSGRDADDGRPGRRRRCASATRSRSSRRPRAFDSCASRRRTSSRCCARSSSGASANEPSLTPIGYFLSPRGVWPSIRLMLREVRVKNFAVVESVTAPFAPGLNVLTGETGAGKSILIDAILLVRGRPGPDRCHPRRCRHRDRRGRLRAAPGSPRRARCSTRPGLGGGRQRQVVVRRELARSGRHRVFVNDSPVTVALLERLGDVLVEAPRPARAPAAARAACVSSSCSTASPMPRTRCARRGRAAREVPGGAGARPTGCARQSATGPAQRISALSGLASSTPPELREGEEDALRTRAPAPAARRAVQRRGGRVRGAPRRGAAVGRRAAGRARPASSRT